MPSLGWWTCCIRPDIVVLTDLWSQVHHATCTAVTKPVWIITPHWLFTGHVGIIKSLLLYFGSPTWWIILCWDVSLDIPLAGSAHTAILSSTFSVWNGFCLMASLGNSHSIGGPLPTKTAGTALLSRMDGNLHSSLSHDDGYKRVQLPAPNFLYPAYFYSWICYQFNHELCEHALFCN